MPINITFRTQLLGGVTEFCTACNVPILQSALHLVELIVMLARYKEEGSPLYPEVYVTTDIDSLMSMLPDSEKITLGNVSRDLPGIKHAIKKTAPLARGGWLVFLNDRDQTLSYGLFRGTIKPTALLTDKILLDTQNPTPVTKVFQIAEECVEVVNSLGSRHLIYLNHKNEEGPAPLEALDNLIHAICKNVEVELKEPTESYLTKILYNALRVSHGTIIAVTDKAKPPKSIFNDGIELNPKIDFPQLIKATKKDELDATRLITAASLLEGMLNSDGIILFNNKGQLLGFNYFIKVKSPTGVTGGARRRAFNSVQSKFTRGIESAFIQSQDGWSEFQGE